MVKMLAVILAAGTGLTVLCDLSSLFSEAIVVSVGTLVLLTGSAITSITAGHRIVGRVRSIGFGLAVSVVLGQNFVLWAAGSVAAIVIGMLALGAVLFVLYAVLYQSLPNGQPAAASNARNSFF